MTLLFLGCESEAPPDANTPAASKAESSKGELQKPASPEIAEAPEVAAPEPTPEWVLLPFDTELWAAPKDDALAIKLVADENATGEGRVARVVESKDGWWALETVDVAALPIFEKAAPMAIMAIEGLDFYTLRLWVKAGTGTALKPKPSGAMALPLAARSTSGKAMAIDELQSGREVSSKLERVQHVEVGAQVFWPNGEPAGTVHRSHSFAEDGAIRKRDGGGKQRCFGVRVGPQKNSATTLCFRAEDVQQRETTAGLLAAMGEPMSGGMMGQGKSFSGFAGGTIGEDSGIGGATMGGAGTGSSTAKVSIKAKVSIASFSGPKSVRTFIDGKLQSLKYCYERELVKDPTVAGTLTLSFQVGASGVNKVSASGGSEAVADCMSRAVRRWRISEEDSVFVELTLKLSP